MKWKKNLISLLLLVIMLVNSVGGIRQDVFAAQEDSFEEIENNITEFSGTDSVGNMLADALQETRQENESTSYITDLIMDGDVATVNFQTDRDCDLFVAIYDEEMIQMFGVGNTTISSEKTSADIRIKWAETRPSYFVSVAYLLDSVTHEPLCKQFTCKNYTQEMQNFLSSTVNDYNSEYILNLDNDSTTNFAVFKEDTYKFDEIKDKLSVREENGKYVFTNKDKIFSEIKAGDILAYTYSNGKNLIIKIKSVSENNNEVYITACEDIKLEDVFDYVKIESDGDEGGEIIDTTNLEEGVLYEGETHNVGADSSEGSIAFSVAYDIDKPESNIVAKLSLGLKIKTKLYLALNYQYISMCLDYSVKVDGGISGKKDLINIDLGKIEKMIVPTVKVVFSPQFVFQASGSITLSIEYTGSYGGAYDSEEGWINLSTSPKHKKEVSFKGTLFIGIENRLSLEVGVIKDEALNTAFIGKFGASIEGKMKIQSLSSDTSSCKHECKNCIEGIINGVISLKCEASIFKLIKTTVNLGEIKVKVCDFYYSLDYDEKGFGKCPHILYKVTVTVFDQNQNPMRSANLTVEDGKMCYTNTTSTDDNGIVKIYLKEGKYQLSAEAGELFGKKKITIADNEKKVKLFLKQKVTVSPTPTVKPTQPDAKWEKVYLGNYPQKLIEDVTLSNILSELKGDSEIVVYDGAQYYQVADKWYIYQPISWLILKKDGNQALVISENILDVCGLTKDDTNQEEIDWSNSVAREWLNSTFYNRAFNEIEKNCIYETNVETVNCVNTLDKLFYPSENDLRNEQYGFTGDESRIAKQTDFAEHVEANETYLTRDIVPGFFDTVVGVYSWEGSIQYPLRDAWWGARPCMNIDLAKIPDVLSMSEDVEDNSLKENLDREENWENEEENFGFIDGDIILDEDESGFEDELVAENGVEEKIYVEEDSDENVGAVGNENIGDEKWISDEEDILYEDETTESIWEDDFGFCDEKSLNNQEVYDEGEHEECEAEEENGATSLQRSPAEEEERLKQIFASKTYMPYSTKKSIQQNVKKAVFSDLIPNRDYLFVVVKLIETEPLLESDNILYLTQKTSDEHGQIEVEYIPLEESKNVMIYGMSNKRIEDSQITVSDVVYDGDIHVPDVTVIYNGLELQEDNDYILGKIENYNIGQYSLIIKGCNEYIGEVEKKYNIICKHQYIVDILKQPSCGEVGLKCEKCSICGKRKEKSESNIPSTGKHVYGDWSVAEEATALTTGKRVRKCNICGKIENADIGKLSPKISVNATNIRLKIKQSTNKLKITGLAKGDYIVSWKSSNNKIVKVTSSGKIIAQKKTGNAIVTITLASGLMQKITVKVQKGIVKTKKISGVPKNLVLKKGKSYNLKPVISPFTSLEKITFASANKKIATVSKNGKIKALKKGSVKITIKSGKKKVICRVKVK